MSRFKTPSTCKVAAYCLSDKSFYFLDIQAFGGESRSMNVPQCRPFSFTKSCEISWHRQTRILAAG